MKCKLCLEEKRLLKKSHIIPDFMYQELFAEKHRIVKFEIQDIESKKFIQSGDWESNILCKECDGGVIGKFETYAAKVLFGGGIGIYVKKYKKRDGLEFMQIEGLEYKEFKLFLLSVLWRASISSRPFFKNVNLGPYEEVIRRMIIEGNPRGQGDFPCIINSFRNHGLMKKSIIEPTKGSMNEKTLYYFLINGFLFIFKIIKNEKIDWILDASISEIGDFKIIYTSKEQQKKFLKEYIGGGG